MDRSPRDKVPPRTLPVVYVAFAHLCLATAFFLVATRPEAMGFFLSPRVLSVVHLVTLGWITSTVLGTTYIVGPLALRTIPRVGRVDQIACGLYVAGALGVASRFWITGTFPESGYWGIAGSGALILPAVACVAVRTWRALATGGAPLPVRLHVAAAYVNLVLAALLGTLNAINRESSFLPGNVYQNVFAHAHLAGFGWATLMVVGVGYRLLAMLFPAAPPGAKPVWVSLVLFETGVLGLTLTLLFAPAWAPLFAVVAAAAVLFFLALVVRMRRQPRPPPRKLKRPDFGVLHILSALLYLLFAAGAGLFVVFSSEWELSAIWLYGVAGLVGFLAQVIVGVEMRLLPMFSFLEGWVGSDYRRAPPSPHEMPRRALQAASCFLWTPGVPLLAAGLALEARWAIVAGAWCLFLGVVAAVVNNALVLRHAYAVQRI